MFDRKHNLAELISMCIIGLLFGVIVGLWLVASHNNIPKEEKTFTLEEMTNMAEYSFISGASQMQNRIVITIRLSTEQQAEAQMHFEYITEEFKQQIDSICQLAKHLKE